MKTNYPSIPTYGESIGGGVVEPPPIPGVWQDFNMIAGAWSTNAGYSNGDTIAAAGSISREPVTGFTMSYLYTIVGGSLLGRISGDVSGHLSESGRLIMVDETYISTVFGVGFASGHTDFTSPLPITFADSVSYDIRFPLLSELTPVTAAFSAGPELYPEDLTNLPPWVIEGHPITIFNTSGTAYLTMTWDTDHWVHDSSDMTDATGDGTISGGPSGSLWWPISWTGFAPPPEPVVGYRYWGISIPRSNAGEAGLIFFNVSTDVDNMYADTSVSTGVVHSDVPTHSYGAASNLKIKNNLGWKFFNSGGSGTNHSIIYSDMGSKVDPEWIIAQQGNNGKNHTGIGVVVVASDDAINWVEITNPIENFTAAPRNFNVIPGVVYTKQPFPTVFKRVGVLFAEAQHASNVVRARYCRISTESGNQVLTAENAELIPSGTILNPGNMLSDAASPYSQIPATDNENESVILSPNDVLDVSFQNTGIRNTSGYGANYCCPAFSMNGVDWLVGINSIIRDTSTSTGGVTTSVANSWPFSLKE